jgi:hypothetical protein
MKIPLFSIILAILIVPAIAQDFSITPQSKSLDITFNSPNGERGWSNPYVETFEIVITNEMNHTLPVRVSSSSDDLSYVSVSSSKSILSIPPLGSESVTITVKVVDSAADGGRYSGRVRFTSDFQTKFVDVTIETHWPPPTLILQGDLNFGELKSGNSYSRSFTLKEIYRFRKANNVNIKFVEDGAIYSATASPSTFSFIDSSGRSITFSFKVKDRNVVPDTYSMPISVSSTNDAQLISKLKYSIPKPVVEVGQPQNELIFDYGKPDNGNQKIVISERGGKTPLENTVISFKKMYRELEDVKKEYGQTTWFSFPKQMDYITPGGSKTIEINVIKPEDAPVGKYTWEGEVKTKYAGNEPIQFSFSVRPPDIDNLKKTLTDLKSSQLYKNHPQAENLLSTTESLLLKDETRLADITNVISLTNIVIKFFSSSNDAYGYLQQGNSGYVEAYEKFMESNEEINELNSITLKHTYDSENTDIKTSAASVWKEVAHDLVIRLEQRADRFSNSSYPDASYVEAKRMHEKIGEICSLLNDSMCVQDQNSKIAGMNTKIEQLILENAFLESEIKRVQEDINANTWSFSSIKLIKNPLRFSALLDKFNEMIENYNHIIRNYQLIEDQIGLVKTEENLAAMKKEYWNFRIVNSIYIIFLGIVIIVTAWKSVRGFLYYQADANDMRLAEVAQLKRMS